MAVAFSVIFMAHIEKQLINASPDKALLWERFIDDIFPMGNLWYNPPASMTSRLASVTFKMASKVFIEETDKDFDFITDILFRFLGIWRC